MAQVGIENLDGRRWYDRHWRNYRRGSKGWAAGSGIAMKLLQRGADVLSIAIGVILGGSVLILAGRGAAYLPLIDAWLSPVVRLDDITDIYREAHDDEHTTGRIGFTLKMTKLTDAQPLPYRFYVNTVLSAQIPISVELCDDKNRRLKKQAYDKHPVGATWSRRYCAELPGTISDEDDITVSGFGLHRRHPLWDTKTPLPPFSIGAAPLS